METQGAIAFISLIVRAHRQLAFQNKEVLTTIPFYELMSINDEAITVL